MQHNTGVIQSNEVIPNLGVTGIWSLKTPYNVLLEPNVEYTCVSVTKISALVADGIDVETTVYLNNGDVDNYELDYNKGSYIIKLQSAIGNVVSIPNSCITGVTNSDGINYISVIMGISLSILPEYVDLSTLKNQISDLIFSTIGVRSNVFESIIGKSIIIPHDKHEAIQTARLNNLSVTTTPLIENIQLKEDLHKAVQKIQLLENYIRTNS